MAMPTKQVTDKAASDWRPSPFVSHESGVATDSVGEANPGTGNSQNIKSPSFQTTDRGE